MEELELIKNKLLCRIDSYDNYLSQLEDASAVFFKDSVIAIKIECQRSIAKNLRDDLFSGNLSFWDVCGQADVVLGVNCDDLIKEYEACND